MFNISSLKVNYTNGLKSSIYNFNKITYVYGKNNVGKSAMIYALDFALGRSGAKLEDQEGLDNIDSIELKLADDVDILFLKRTSNDDFYYKRAEEDDYLNVDEILYKQEISNFISKGNKKYLDEFFQFNNEKLTFRAFTFFNFVEEKGLGNLAGIFARAKDYEHQKRARRIMTFLYNYKNIHEICKLNVQQKDLQYKLNLYQEAAIKYQYFYKEIINYFIVLNIDIDGKIDDLYKRFLDYKETFKRSNKNRDKDDLNELIKASYALSEELKYQENLAIQAQKLIKRNQKSELMLNAFRDVVKDNEFWKNYIKDIELLIEKHKSNNDVLSIKDYSKTIELIKQKKEKIDQKVYSLSQGMNKVSFDNSSKYLSILENLFNNIKELKEMNEYEKIAKELNKINIKIKDLNKQFDSKLTNSFSEIILKWYRQLGEKVDFAKEDLSKSGFSIDFNPIEASLVGKRNFKENSEEKYVYNPGSMARETTWQILAYLTNLKILIDNFEELPFMRILIIDGINQPFDEYPTSYPAVFKLLEKIATEIGIQLIVVSTIDRCAIDNGPQINLSTGFNKAHNK